MQEIGAMQSVEVFFHLASLLIGIASAIFAFYMYSKLHTKITDVVLFSGIAALFLALHQGVEGFMEFFSIHVDWHIISGLFETGTVLSLLVVAYFLLKTSQMVFIPDEAVKIVPKRKSKVRA